MNDNEKADDSLSGLEGCVLDTCAGLENDAQCIGCLRKQPCHYSPFHITPKAGECEYKVYN